MKFIKVPIKVPIRYLPSKLSKKDKSKQNAYINKINIILAKLYLPIKINPLVIYKMLKKYMILIHYRLVKIYPLKLVALYQL